MAKNKQSSIKVQKKEINEKHIKFYDKTLSILEFILDEFSRELTRADIEFIEMPKNSVAVLDFLISAIGKVQKGQRLALGLDEDKYENIEPVINIVEGLSEEKI
ncbi:hypothetical protein IJ750_01425 [bacterium]|nr:hypothetical protein [bacterium]